MIRKKSEKNKHYSCKSWVPNKSGSTSPPELNRRWHFEYNSKISLNFFLVSAANAIR